jgi:predicted small secreted protein
MHRSLCGIVVVGAVVLAACATTTVESGWSGAGLHVVDGYWILAERQCDMRSADMCATEATLAETALSIDPRDVVRAASAGLPTWRSVRSDGQVVVVIQSRSGFAYFMILDLTDGSRRVVGVSCTGVPNPDGSANCRSGPFDDYRVGAAPSF